MGSSRASRSLLLAPLMLALLPPAHAVRKPHTVALGRARLAGYSAAGDPAGAAPGEKTLPVRPLVVDDKVKDWTTGEVHDITRRSFVVRRALRLNDALPGEKGEHWVWQRGPWLLIDRSTGHVLALRLPDYDPAVSRVVWFRDYAAYCGLTSSGKSLFAVVAQVGSRKPVLSKKLSAWVPGESALPACAPAQWQRDPLQITFQQSGAQPVSYSLVGRSAVLVEQDDDPATGAETSSSQ